MYFYRGPEDQTILQFKDDEVAECRWMSGEEIIQSIAEDASQWVLPLEEFEPIYRDAKERIVE